MMRRGRFVSHLKEHKIHVHTTVHVYACTTCEGQDEPGAEAGPGLQGF